MPKPAHTSKPNRSIEDEDDFALDPSLSDDGDFAGSDVSMSDNDDDEDDDDDMMGDSSPSADLEVSEDEAEALLANQQDGINAAALDEEAEAERDEENPSNDTTEENSKKRKRSQKEKSKERKKQKFAEELDRATLKEHTPLAQAENLARQLLDFTLKDCQMTTLEVQDKLLAEPCFLDISDFSKVDDSAFPDLVRRAVPNIDEYMLDPETGKPKATSKANLRKQGPLVLFLCTSGIRCMDVIRALRPLTGGDQEHAGGSGGRGGSFRGGRGGRGNSRGGPRGGSSRGGGFGGDARRSQPAMRLRVGKLFAKHMKVDEQVKYLEGYPVHLAVGTPNRVAKLLEAGALKTGNLKCIVLDASFRDGKQRTLFTAAESRSEFFALYMAWLSGLCKGEELRAQKEAEAEALKRKQDTTDAQEDKDVEMADVDEAAAGDGQQQPPVRSFRIDDDSDTSSDSDMDTDNEAAADGADDGPKKLDSEATEGKPLSKRKAKKEARRLAKKAKREARKQHKNKPPLMCMF